MSNPKNLIEKMLSLQPNLTEEELLRRIQKKREETGRLLTQEGAAYMVANELGIDLSDEYVVKTQMNVKDLIVGASDATVVGRVLDVSPIQTFRRKDGVEGKVARLVVSDNTGSVNVVLWNAKTRVIDQGRVSPTQLIRASHGYVRKGLNGNPELNIGRRGTVVVLSSKPAFEVNKPVKSLSKICELKEGTNFVSFIGVVMGFSGISYFKRANNKPGRVMRVRLVDDTGRIKAVFWDEKIEHLKKISKGDALQIEGGRVRRGLGSVLEVHVGRFTQVTLLKDSKMPVRLSLIKIEDLKLGMNDVDVLGRVVNVGQTREFKRRSGEVGKVRSLRLIDETGSVRFSLWNDKSDLIDKITIGDIVLVEGSYTRQGLGDGIELNLAELGSITINPKIEGAKNIPTVLSNVTFIRELMPGMANVTVEGEVIDEQIVREVTTKRGSDLKVVSIRIRDETGEIRVSLWGNLTESVDGVTNGAHLRIGAAYVKRGVRGDLELSSGFKDVKVQRRSENKTKRRTVSLLDTFFEKNTD